MFLMEGYFCVLPTLFLIRNWPLWPRCKPHGNLTERVTEVKDSAKLTSNGFEDVSVRFNMFALPLVILASLFLVDQTIVAQPKPGGVNLRSLSRRTQVGPMQSSTLIVESVTSSKDVAADFELVRQLDKHQVSFFSFPNPTITLLQTRAECRWHNNN